MRLPWLAKKRPLDLVWLTDDLALGSAPLASQWEAMFAAGVGAVLEIRSEEQDDVVMLEARGVAYRRADVPDFGAPTPDELHDLVLWAIERMQGRQRVLVHCRMGQGRSAMVACATLVALGFPLSVAYSMLRAARPNVALSPKQVTVLESFAVRIEDERQQPAQPT